MNVCILHFSLGPLSELSLGAQVLLDASERIIWENDPIFSDLVD